MSEPIVTREQIVQSAEQAARDAAAGRPAENPFPSFTDAGARWDVHFKRACIELVPESEASA